MNAFLLDFEPEDPKTLLRRSAELVRLSVGAGGMSFPFCSACSLSISLAKRFLALLGKALLELEASCVRVEGDGVVDDEGVENDAE